MSSTCRLIGLNRQNYYRLIKQEEKIQMISRQVVQLVQEVRMRMPRLGGKKLYHILKAPLRTMKIGRDKLFDILRANRLLIKRKRQYRVTTNSHHRFKKHKNLVEHLVIKKPEQVFVCDITYLGDRKNPMYLALVTDAYSKKIMGYDVSKSLASSGAEAALKMAISKRVYPQRPLIHHSDRGLQYCCDGYQKILKKAKIGCSMTEKYDPYQNAVAERVNGILKQEFIGEVKINDLKLMKILIENSIEIYNNERPHFSSHLLTPKQMHKQQIIKMKTYKTKTGHQTHLASS